ncbi:MAG TPA: SusC/RagA family TonB-linked outer membrane protein [Chryseolinea sp.]|nr:SusC/RagA family TonB-linked outer membrane protein [Chryseolinea sp.]
MQVRSILAGFCLAMTFPFMLLGQTSINSDTLQTKKLDSQDNGSAIQKLEEKSFNKGITHSPVQLFNGLLTGIGAAKVGNDPNADYIMRIRGLSTLQESTTPIFVVDGFITDNLLLIDPADINEITILKDASATSMYGPRGANGVILLNTKRASGAKTISYRTSISIETPTMHLEPSSTSKYKTFPNITDYGDQTNWVDEVTQNGISTVNNLSVTGGKKSFSFRASANYRTAKGTLVGSGFQQLNGRVDLQQKAFQNKLTLGLGSGITQRNSDFGFREAFKYLWNANPTMPINNPDAPQYGNYYQSQTFDVYNPTGVVSQNTNSGEEKTIFAGVNAKYEFSGRVKGLSALTSYTISTQDDEFGTYYSKSSYYVGFARNGFAKRTTQAITNQQVDVGLNYDKKIGWVDMKLGAGYQYQVSSEDGEYMAGGDFPSDEGGYEQVQDAGDFQNDKGIIEQLEEGFTIVSYRATGFFRFREKYFLSAAANYSGSTRFGSNNKWGLFPAITGGVEWKNVRVRAGWGKSGNIPQRSNLSESQLVVSGKTYYNGDYIDTYAVIRNANPDLKWEEKSEVNIGTDVNMAKGRLQVSLDLFSNKVYDLLTEVTVPVPPNVAPSTFVNLGEISNKGVELYISASVIRSKKFSWDLGLNMSGVSTKMKSLSGNGYSIGTDGVMYVGNPLEEGGGCGCGSPGYIRIKEGEKLGEIYVPVFVGVMEDGRANLQDTNGDGQPDPKVVGKALPKFTFGFNNSFSYKDFTLSFLLRGAAGHSKINSYRLLHESTQVVSFYNIVTTKYFDPKLTQSVLSSLYVEKASFVKLDNISLSYRVPAKVALSVNFTVQNLFAISSYTGLDPEVVYGEIEQKGNTKLVLNKSPLVSGLDKRSDYAPARIFSIGASVLF